MSILCCPSHLTGQLTSDHAEQSGSDFRDLSEATLSLSPPQHNAIRRRRILSLSVTRHRTLPSDPPLPALRKRIGELLAKVDEATGQPVAFALAPFDTRADRVRMGESACGNLYVPFRRRRLCCFSGSPRRRGAASPTFCDTRMKCHCASETDEESSSPVAPRKAAKCELLAPLLCAHCTSRADLPAPLAQRHDAHLRRLAAG
jgi:hypothetical protein